MENVEICNITAQNPQSNIIKKGRIIL